MNIKVFNLALLAGWLLVLIGGVILNPGAGLVAGGALLILIVFVVSRIAGIYAPPAEQEETH